MGTLKQRFFSSLYSSYLIQGLTSGANFFLRLGLAWLILPDQFGLFAIALFVITVINAIRDGGLESQVVRDPDPDYGSVFWFHLGSGLFCAGLTWLGAPLLAGFSPLLPPVLRLFSPIIVLSALSTVPLLYYHRSLQLRLTLIPRLVQVAVFALAAVGLAARGYGVLALVLAKLISEAALVAALWLRFRMPAGWGFRWTTLRPLLWRARYLYLLGLIELLAIDIDKAILSRNCSETVVGYYFMAWSLVFSLSKALEPAFIRVLFPSFSRLQHDPIRAGRLYSWATLAIITIEAPCYLALAAFAGDLVGVLFPSAWQGVASIAAALAFLPILDPFSMLGVEVLRSRHRDFSLFLPASASLAILILLGNYLTIRYAALGMVLTNYVGHLTSLIIILRVRREIPAGFRHLFRRLPTVYVVALVCIGIALLVPFAAPLVRLAAAAGAVLFAWLVLGLIFFRDPRPILNLERD